MHGFPFQVEVIRTNRKRSASISLSDDGIKVRVPLTLSDHRIIDLINKRKPWIIKKFQEKANRPIYKEKEYVSGETFTYLGKNYRLKVSKGLSSSVKLKRGYLEVILLETDNDPKTTIRLLLREWFKAHAKKHLIDKTKRFAKIIGVKPNSISIKDYKSRWGSCSFQGDISYNWKVIHAPHSIVDYVVIHELCHILQYNHSNKFWRHVESYVPNWRECKDWLKLNNIAEDL